MRSLSMSLLITKAGVSSGSADLTKDLGGAVFQALLGTLLAVAYIEYFVKSFNTLPPAQDIISSYQGAQAVAKALPEANARELIATAQHDHTQGKGWVWGSPCPGSHWRCARMVEISS